MNRASKKVFPPWNSEVRPGDGKPFKGLKKIAEEYNADRQMTIDKLRREGGIKEIYPSKKVLDEALDEVILPQDHPLHCECDKCYPMEAKMDDDSTLEL